MTHERKCPCRGTQAGPAVQIQQLDSRPTEAGCSTRKDCGIRAGRNKRGALQATINQYVLPLLDGKKVPQRINAPLLLATAENAASFLKK